MSLPVIPGLQKGSKEPTQFDIVPATGFFKGNLKTRNPLLSYQDDITENVPSFLNNLTNVAAYRRAIMCRNDLRIKVGRAAKDKFIVHNSLEGVGRNTNSIFTKPKNNHPLLIQADSNTVSRPSKLGRPK
jgi:hypothetical protein